MVSPAPSRPEFSWSELLDRRVIFVVGKGGVGRTTMTAAMARAAAAKGKRVLVTEIAEPDGDYSPLARLYGRENLPVDRERLEDGVEGCLLWSRKGHSLFLERVLPSMLVKAGMRSGSLNRFLDAAPSFNEMGVFYRLLDLMSAERDGVPTHDLLLIDMPATGHSLALTGLPERLLILMPTGPIADMMRKGQEFLYDPARTAACVVTLPEILPVTECLELIDGLRADRIPIGTVLVNKVIADRFTDDERAALEPILEGRAVFGANRFRTMAQIERSILRLRHGAAVPLMQVPEFVELGDELIDRVTDVMMSEAP